MLLHTESDGILTDLTFDIIGHRYSLRELQGLKMDFQIGIYDRAQVRSKFDGVDELELLEQIEDYDGEVLPFIQIETKAIHDENTGFLPETEDGDSAFVLEIELNDPARNKGLAVFFTDEDGDGEWILSNSSYNISETSRSFEFLIPRPQSIDRTDDELEFGIRNRRVIRIISWTDDLPEGYFEKKEVKHKRYSLIQVKMRAPGDWVFEEFPENQREREEMWKFLSTGKALLFVHGTNGTASIAFRRFIDQRDWMEEVYEKYGDRIFCFNHPTLFRGVKHNAKKLKKFLTETKDKLDLDIITRSRGSLVARQVLEKELLPDKIRVEKLVMLSGPNQGTPASKGLNKLKVIRVNQLLAKLAKKCGHLPDKLDKQELYYQVAQVKERVLVGQGKALIQGATDQAIGSEFLNDLNQGSSEAARVVELPKYYAITAVFDPEKMSLPGHERLKHKLARKLKNIFEDHENDGIVPSKGAMGTLGNGITNVYFNLNPARCYVLQNSENIHHINLPDSKEVRDKVLAFLKE